VAAAAGLLSLTTQAQPQGIEPQALRLLKASTDFLGSQQQFSLDTRGSLEVVLHSGQKIQFDHTARQSIQRPNKLRAERVGALSEQVIVYDGRSLTLYNPIDNVYSVIPVPDTLEAMLDYARTSLDLVAPAGDLIFKDAYAVLTADVLSGFVVGKSIIEGVRCDHLAFRAPHVDWQIWIQDGAQPLPRKIVLTTRDMANAPQFSVTITKWDLQPRFVDPTFTFSPPPGAKRVDLVRQ
jgi:hypothetical protein